MSIEFEARMRLTEERILVRDVRFVLSIEFEARTQLTEERFRVTMIGFLDVVLFHLLCTLYFRDAHVVLWA